MKTSKVISSYFVAILFILALCVPTFLKIVKAKTESLLGAVVKVEKPIYIWEDLLSGKFQHDYDLWYNRNFYSRTHMVKKYSQIKFDIFRKAVGTQVIIGRDNTFFEPGYLMYIDPEYPDEHIDLIKSVQDKCEKLGKKFLYILPPNKVLIYPEYTPLRYSHVVKKILENPFHITLSERLEAKGIHYFNSTPFLLTKKKDYNLFAKTGTHWNLVAAALVLEEISRKIPLLFNSNIVIQDIESSHTPYSADDDLLALSNIKRVPQTTYYNPLFEKYDIEKSKVFLNGTSFDWQLIALLAEFSVVDEIEYTYLHRHHSGELYAILNKNISYHELLKDKDIVMIASGPTGRILLPSLKRIDYALGLMLADYETDQFQNELTPEDTNISIKPFENTVNAEAGKDLIFSVKFTNDSKSIQSSYMPNPVMLASYWTLRNGEFLKNEERPRHALEGLVLPGETADVVINTKAPDEPGEYLLHITAVQELVMWYEAYNNKLPISILVRVR
jgi:hypothetical protein